MFFYKQNSVNAASYNRLSREDGDKMESDSIRNQKDLISDYLQRSKKYVVVKWVIFLFLLFPQSKNTWDYFL